MNRLDIPYIAYFNDTTDWLKMATYVPPAWQKGVVYSAYSAGNYNSLQVDNYGEPSIAFYDITNGDLVYAYFRLNTWYFETVDSNGDVGQYVSLVVDGNRIPNISYYDATNGHLKYAVYVGSGGGNCGTNDNWSCTTLDTAPNTGLYTSITLDSNGRPAISYYAYQEYTVNKITYTNGELRCAYKSPINAWVFEKIDSVQANSTLGKEAGFYSSIAYDANNKLFISYYNLTEGSLKLAEYALNSGNCSMNWTCTTVDGASPSEDVGKYPSMKIDASGNRHVSYYDITHGTLKYALYKGSQGGNCGLGNASDWACMTVDKNGNVGLFTSLALTQAGLPAISYYDLTQGDLKYASQATLPSVYQSVYLFLPYLKK
jgi:hypothetical protein